ncbi:preprotein translocase subunit SecA [Chloroflexota bacterium]
MFKLFGGLVDSNEKVIKRLQPTVDSINELEPEFQKLTDEQLRRKTDDFKTRLQSGSSLDELLTETFAAVREAARRTIGLRHFDVQLIGGIVLHQGRIAEMKTGEGKTLVATLPLYLNSLTGQGCHLVTVNDYLARRDPYWMAPVYHALGVSVASIYPMQNPGEHTPAFLYDPDYDSEDSRWPHFRPVPRKEAYQADITYGTSSEFGFDYLRDNMTIDLSQFVQGKLNYAIVDETDNLLIDEARTPLIISAAAEDAGPIYNTVNDAVSHMKLLTQPRAPITFEEKEEDAALDEQYDYIAYDKERYIRETARGQEKLARAFRMRVDDLFGSEDIEDHKQLTLEEAKMRNDILSIFRKSMTAHALYKRDREYHVKDGQVIIVDESTGRLMFGRRYSEGLHQAIEAKEKVKVQKETMTVATITIQNYFRMYEKLAGMTGTAATEAEEFHKIYNLDVVTIPTNKRMIREDHPDQIYKDEDAKFKAVAREVEQLHKEGQPILIGTVSIEKSEDLSERLKRKGIPHQVLNAKEHTKEASIIAQAGRPGMVTVATNMAGRGVDIILGGNPNDRDLKEWQKEHDKVLENGGLHIIGTERHEARRIDNQLRGRAGRQGDPGSSRFYVSLEDDVVRRFGGDRIRGLMEWAGMDEETPIENKLVNKAVEGAQVRVEGHNFDIRKHLVEYDDVVNQQRELIYNERKKILSGADLKTNILSMVREEIQGIIATHLADEYGVDWNVEGLINNVSIILPLPPDTNADTIPKMKAKDLEDNLFQQAEAMYEQRENELASENMRLLERVLMLRTIDSLWKEHLTNMENMRLQAGWETLRQVKAVDAYKNQGYQQFQQLLATIQHEVARTIYHVGLVKREAPASSRQPVATRDAVAKQPQPVAAGSSSNPQPKPTVGHKVGRNDPCPCGSGKKYKKCCGQ